MSHLLQSSLTMPMIVPVGQILATIKRLTLYVSHASFPLPLCYTLMGRTEEDLPWNKWMDILIRKDRAILPMLFQSHVYSKMIASNQVDGRGEVLAMLAV